MPLLHEIFYFNKQRTFNIDINKKHDFLFQILNGICEVVKLKNISQFNNFFTIYLQLLCRKYYFTKGSQDQF